MTERLAILAQGRPAAGINNAIYSVGTGKQVVVSAIIVCNTSATATTYRIHCSLAGTGSVADALFYDVPIAGNATAVLQIGLALSAGSTFVVQSGGTLTFTFTGQEIS